MKTKIQYAIERAMEEDSRRSAEQVAVSRLFHAAADKIPPPPAAELEARLTELLRLDPATLQANRTKQEDAFCVALEELSTLR